jgi:putative membrane protein
MRGNVLVAILLCIASAPLNEDLARRLSPEALLPILTIVVTVFTGFRSNQAYLRWWEARLIWGAMVNESRNWQLQLLALLPVAAEGSPQHTALLERQVQLVWTLNRELRPGGTAPTPSSQELLSQQAQALRALAASGSLDPSGLQSLLRVQDGICNALGGLERIRLTPIPAAYDLFIRILVWSFGFLLFVRLDVLDQGLGTLEGFLGFLAFITAERLAAFTENPFQSKVFGLPMNHICATISRDLLGASHPLAVPPEGSQSPVWS